MSKIIAFPKLQCNLSANFYEIYHLLNYFDVAYNYIKQAFYNLAHYISLIIPKNKPTRCLHFYGPILKDGYAN